MQVEASQEVVHLADDGTTGHKATEHFSKVSHGADQVCAKCRRRTSLFTEKDRKTSVSFNCIFTKDVDHSKVLVRFFYLHFFY